MSGNEQGISIMKRSVHVVGGGIGGLATAGCFAQRGWNVVVHERSSELREVGAGIFLKENSIRVLEELQCLDAVVQQGTRLTTSEIKDRNGRKILSRNVGSERVWTVLRADLHRELATAAMSFGADVKLNSQIKDISPDGRLTTQDGTSYQADLIVGADGLGSVVRSQAGLERKAVRMANGSTRILLPRTPEDPTSGSVEYWRGHKRVVVVPVGKDTLYFCASSREDDARGVAIPFDIAYWSECFPELSSLFARVTPGIGIHHTHGMARVSGWHRGRIAILGDAVHGQPPNLGQGAGMAISNGHALAVCVERHSTVEAGLAEWESNYRKITEQIQEWSIGWDHFVHKWPLPLEGLRSSVIWSLTHYPATRRHWGRLYRGLTKADEAGSPSPTPINGH
jgi:2-polyprenyl-6-methoxyphenol hydroxylase-like FAD-dependent oxidoreductase